MIGVSIRFTRGLSAILAMAFIVSALLAGSALCDDWDKYKPANSVGSGDNDWWTAYPDQNAEAGSTVDHPQWVLDALKEKPVLILDHTKDCSSCKKQKAIVDKVLESYGGEITYYDLMADSKDKRAFEALDIYNPSGKEQYVPTTVFLTLTKGSDGKVGVAWHSVIDDMTEENFNSYLKDAIYYYRQNANTTGK